MSRFTAQGGDEGLPGNRTDAARATLLLFSHNAHAHSHPFVMFTNHFNPGDDQWTKEASVFHALLGWPAALYGALLPLLSGVHEWITPLANGDCIVSNGNMMQNNVHLQCPLFWDFGCQTRCGSPGIVLFIGEL